ncbi:MAG: Lar family restriction alleviation protein [Sphaerochaetaceae bacterium]
MGKHNLGDQWVAVLADGKNHMLKRVAFGEGPDSANCDGCVWAGNDNCDSNDMPCTTIDLGELDENGLLPCPFCEAKADFTPQEPSHNPAITNFCSVSCPRCGMVEDVCFDDENELREAWNRRNA